MPRVTLRGRTAELSAVLGAVRRVSRCGRGAIVALVGEPGIGKTSLLRDAAEQARRQGHVIGVGKTEEIDQIAAGAPLLEALRSGTQPLLDTAVFAGLASHYEQPLWLVDRIAELLAARAAQQPVLIGLDDVQWADPLTRFALRLLPSRLADVPVTWLLTSRLAPPDSLDSILAGADPAIAVTRIDLGPIADADLEALAGDRLGADPDDITRSLLRGVGGNPFWAVQLLTGLARRRAHGLPETGLHAELITGIRQRTRILPDIVRAVIQAVAVSGRAIPPDAVASLMGGVTGAMVFSGRVASPGRGPAHRHRACFSLPHDLIREAVYAQIPPPERARLHRARGRQLVVAAETALPAAPHSWPAPRRATSRPSR